MVTGGGGVGAFQALWGPSALITVRAVYVLHRKHLVSPLQCHAQQSSQENGPDEETGRNKMGSQNENLGPGLHRNCQTPHGVCLRCRSSAARTNLDQLTKTQNAGLRIITDAMKTTPISEVEGTVGLMSFEERRKEKFLRQSEKKKRLPSHPSFFHV